MSAQWNRDESVVSDLNIIHYSINSRYKCCFLVFAFTKTRLLWTMRPLLSPLIVHIITKEVNIIYITKYTVIKAAKCFSSVYCSSVDTSNRQVLTLTLISSITMELMTTPCYTCVNAHRCHSQCIQTPFPSPIHHPHATAMLYNVRLRLLLSHPLT